MFDLYFAGIQAKELDEFIVSKDCCRLFSYADKPKSRLAMYEENNSKIFLDSGAFGVAHSGKNISLDQYIEFINNYPRVTLFACLDVIPWPTLNTQTAEVSAEQSWQNYIYMIDNVKEEFKDKIVPVYHYGEDFKYLTRMLEGYNGYKPKYIAFGGRGGVHTKDLYPSLDKFFDVIKKSNNPDVKTHAFGITVLKLLETYPFTSADSTSFLQTAINGGIFCDCLKGAMVKISSNTKGDTKNYLHKNTDIKNAIKHEVERLGYTIESLQTDYRARLKFNVDYFIRWQKDYKYTPRAIKRKGLF